MVYVIIYSNFIAEVIDHRSTANDVSQSENSAVRVVAASNVFDEGADGRRTDRSRDSQFSRFA